MGFFKSRYKSFKAALKGLLYLLKTQVNFIIEISAAIIVVILGLIFSIKIPEWIVLIFTIFLVLISEAVNTAIEILCNKIEKKKNKKIKIVKDISAAVVLLSVILSIIIGIVIFLPYVKALF